MHVVPAAPLDYEVREVDVTFRLGNELGRQDDDIIAIHSALIGSGTCVEPDGRHGDAVLDYRIRWERCGGYPSNKAHVQFLGHEACGDGTDQSDARESDDGDGVIDDNDRVAIGNPNPDIYGNIFTNLTWKNLRLDVNFRYSLGNDVYNYQRSILEGANTTYNQTAAMCNRWTYEGQVTDMPKVTYIDSEDWRNNERMSDRWIEDGSYLKLKNVRLTYIVPVHNEYIQGLRVWGEANNLFTITRYLGVDPETSARNSVLFQGIDTGLLSVGRSFNLGVSINL